MADWKAKLKALGPCPEAYRWAIEHRTLREAWRQCERRDWMAWLYEAGQVQHLAPDSLYDCIGIPGAPLGNDPESLMEWRLQDAYIILDFVPNPPRLPEIG